jgi:mRNA interferase RelE/StbE
MVNREPDPQAFQVESDKRVRKFLNRHPDLAEKWPDIREYLTQQPHTGTHITHLKGQYQCSRRWRFDPYRILFDIDNSARRVYVFDADTRQNIY